jgi:hypothetical protein
MSVIRMDTFTGPIRYTFKLAQKPTGHFKVRIQAHDIVNLAPHKFEDKCDSNKDHLTTLINCIDTKSTLAARLANEPRIGQKSRKSTPLKINIASLSRERASPAHLSPTIHTETISRLAEIRQIIGTRQSSSECVTEDNHGRPPAYKASRLDDNPVDFEQPELLTESAVERALNALCLNARWTCVYAPRPTPTAVQHVAVDVHALTLTKQQVRVAVKAFTDTQII